ncbi:MAG TPA: chemotaxis protein CheW [Anaeromyxobacteraceae bacterium]|nr:chemotaxis protein CheW [Anaeromyxobacteraceae bacterium]
MESLPAERKALLFTAGGIRLALRLSQVLEIVATPHPSREIAFRGAALHALPVAAALGRPAGPARFALVTEANPPLALQVDLVHRIVDLAQAEVFQLPAGTILPVPPPFLGALVSEGAIALELAVATLGPLPAKPAFAHSVPPPELDAPRTRELHFVRGRRTFAVPLHILARVLEAPEVCPVPLAPPAHRGLLYHGRAIHPVIDMEVLYGGQASEHAGKALLLDAGANAIAVLADRILPADDRGEGVCRPSWDALFASPEEQGRNAPKTASNLDK